MPKVNGKHFPYTEKGEIATKKEMDRMMKKEMDRMMKKAKKK